MYKYINGVLIFMTAKEIVDNIQKELLKWFEPKHATHSSKTSICLVCNVLEKAVLCCQSVSCIRRHPIPMLPA